MTWQTYLKNIPLNECSVGYFDQKTKNFVAQKLCILKLLNRLR